MDIQTYSEAADRTAIYRKSIITYVDTLAIPDPKKADDLVGLLCKCYAILGLTGEAGELANKMKKIIRDDFGLITEDKSLKMLDEGGDTLWYNNAVASEFGGTLEEVAKNNILKLQDRKDKNLIGGSGDDRGKTNVQ